jgi:hypothetical protein
MKSSLSLIPYFTQAPAPYKVTKMKRRKKNLKAVTFFFWGGWILSHVFGATNLRQARKFYTTAGCDG